MVTLENGVIITEEVAKSLQLLEDNPLEFASLILLDPGQFFETLSNIGADMSSEVRETSEEVVIAAVIVGQISQLAAAVSIRRI